MNLLHMKYVVSTADAGSINKAAEELHVAQPNLSRVIREMEADLGIRFFVRSSKGMTLTADGEQFVSRARKILENVDELETMYKEEKPGKQLFSISVPREPIGVVAAVIPTTNPTSTAIFKALICLKTRNGILFSPHPRAKQAIEACRTALMKKSHNMLDASFIEGMACVNGCIGGAGNLTHGEKNKAAVDKYGREALEKTIMDAIAPLG